MRVILVIGMALVLLSGCEDNRNSQFAKCMLQYGEEIGGGKLHLCMEAAGYQIDEAACATILKAAFPDGNLDNSERVYKVMQQCWAPANPVARYFHDWELQMMNAKKKRELGGLKEPPPPAAAAEKPAEKPAEKAVANELVGELLECSVYFNMSQLCTEKANPALSQTLANKADVMRELAVELGTKIGVTLEGFQSSINLLTKQMMERQGNSCVNGSVNIERYSSFCAALSRSIAPRLKELVDGKRCSGSYKC